MSKREQEEFDIDVRIRCFAGAIFCAAALALFTYLWVSKSNSPGGHSDGAGVFFLVMIVWPAVGFLSLMKFAITGRDFKHRNN